LDGFLGDHVQTNVFLHTVLEWSIKWCHIGPKLHPSFDVSSPLGCCPQSHEIL
jgi:hypothetical protein